MILFIALLGNNNYQSLIMNTLSNSLLNINGNTTSNILIANKYNGKHKISYVKIVKSGLHLFIVSRINKYFVSLVIVNYIEVKKERNIKNSL